MNRPIFLVTGTDTGVGKSVLAVALVRHLQRKGLTVAGLKPVCSGGREDARALQRALTSPLLALSEINPWSFRRPIAPGIAGREQPGAPGWREVSAHIRAIADRFAVTIVEAAGGLLSPLTRDGDACDLLRALSAIPLVVCPNRLGAINQSLLVFRALPAQNSRRARLLLMRQARPDTSARSNVEYLRATLGPGRVFEFPRLASGQIRGITPLGWSAGRVLERLCDSLRLSPWGAGTGGNS